MRNQATPADLAQLSGLKSTSEEIDLLVTNLIKYGVFYSPVGVTYPPSDDKLYGMRNNTWVELSGVSYDDTELITTSSLLITDAAPIEEGQSVQLTATATLSDGSTIDVSSQVVWSSNNNAIASVNSTGLVSSSNDGIVNISATYDGLSDSTSLTITQAQAPVIDGATLNGEALTLNGEASTLTI